MKDLKQIFPEMAESDEKTQELLLNAFEDVSKDPFGYLQFRESVLKLSESGHDLESAIRATFTTASTMGLTRQGLINSAHEYLQLLERENEKFDHSHKKHAERKIERRKEKINSMEGKIAELKNEISRLQNKVQEYESFVAQAQREMEEASQKISEKKHLFESQVQALQAAITEDIERFENTIQKTQ